MAKIPKSTRVEPASPQKPLPVAVATSLDPMPLEQFAERLVELVLEAEGWTVHTTAA